MPSRKNKWRRRGRFEFMRVTKRFSDGSPWTPATDVLFVRIKKVACVHLETFDWRNAAPGKTLAICVGTYCSATPMEAARYGRSYLLNRLMLQQQETGHGL